MRYRSTLRSTNGTHIKTKLSTLSWAQAGLEASRRLHRRHEPGTAGRSHGLLSEILNPSKSTIDNLRPNVEELEEWGLSVFATGATTLEQS